MPRATTVAPGSGSTTIAVFVSGSIRTRPSGLPSQSVPPVTANVYAATAWMAAVGWISVAGRSRASIATGVAEAAGAADALDPTISGTTECCVAAGAAVTAVAVATGEVGDAGELPQAATRIIAGTSPIRRRCQKFRNITHLQVGTSPALQAGSHFPTADGVVEFLQMKDWRGAERQYHRGAAACRAAVEGRYVAIDLVELAQ